MSIITTETQLVEALSKAANVIVSVDDYLAWFDGDAAGDGAKFDNAVRSFLGEELYAAADICARLEFVLWFKLGGRVQPLREQELVRSIAENPKTYTNGF